MTVETALAFVLALLVWVIIPGPAILAIVGRSLTNNLASALKLIAGILLGDLFYLCLVLFGMAGLGQILGDFFIIVRMIGTAYLIVLGLRLWFKDSGFNYSAQTDEKPDKYKSFLTGFSITLGNPKAILFHMGFLPTFFDLTAIGVPDALLIIIIFMVVLGSALTFYAAAAGRARFFFGDRRKRRLLNRGAGVMLIGAGIAVAGRE